ncbi:tRNA pseudouridine(55) synthase TruB [Allostreptomyces psammosilenae]|uniref:tRNA pseudouridine synthase B n=1 Tax=Allostreptomyces psammosilenae TaxID=1892865 RepID=A0A853ADC8_9ACTN|nr:tRNA pseudouridine(55) synthase TruB [Allostreptomyces psammosilenae]NYI08448.1 tRNA pseudouridine55 synthase [Allostreptomyces psammosilenae]
MKRKGTGPDGLVIVDKPAGLTSHQVVSRIRRLAGTRRVGHAGTLDPMATGVLIVGVEKATRLLGHLALTEKSYRATVRLGVGTVTDDAEGDPTVWPGADEGVDEAAVAAAAAKLTGEIMQVPSAVSAIKVDGKRSYTRVRSGEEVRLAARPVTVSEFTLHGFRRGVAEVAPAAVPLAEEARPAEPLEAPGAGAAVPPGEGAAAGAVGTVRVPVVDVDVTVTCSSGTYVRALARDLGEDLGTAGHLTMLRRTRVGPYRVEEASTLERLEEEFSVLGLDAAAAAAFPRWDVDAETARLIANGVQIKAPAMLGEEPVAVFGPDGRFTALVVRGRGKVRSLAVFH